MNTELLEHLAPLAPLDFFKFALEVKEAKSFQKLTKLPSTSSLLGEESFADVSLGWNKEAVLIEVVVHLPFQASSFPRFEEGDALELFFDTRDLKSAGHPTRFCHQFLILPQAVNGIQAQELTRFRTDDTHPLCSPEEIGVKSQFKKNSYEMQITLPSHCLHGYDPRNFDRLGFTYRVHRGRGRTQNFSLSPGTYAVEQEPSLWSSIMLRRAL